MDNKVRIVFYRGFKWGKLSINIRDHTSRNLLRFFFVSGQIYTDHKADKKIKSAAQGLITLATYGLGMLIGYWIAGRILSIYTVENGEFDWFYIWIIPGIFSFFVFLFFLTIFKEKNETKYQVNNS